LSLGGLYVERRTLFHKLDPRAKIFWTLLVLAVRLQRSSMA